METSVPQNYLKVRVHYIILCDRIVFEEGKFNYLGVFDRILANDFPVIHDHIYVGFQVNCCPGDWDMEFVIVNSDGKPISAPLPVCMTCKQVLGFATARVLLKNILFIRPGIYTLEMRATGQVVGKRDFYVERSVSQLP